MRVFSSLIVSWSLDIISRMAVAADPLPVIREDQARRWAAGDRVRVEEYIGAVPALGMEDVLVLILAEAGLRRAGGEAPTPAGYEARFPHLAAQADTDTRLLMPVPDGWSYAQARAGELLTDAATVPAA